MNTTDEIRKIILGNKRNIAFLIGNGIHYQFKDCDLSWTELLTKLWREHIDDRAELLKDVSLTEIYDVIEINATGDSRKDDLFRNSLKREVAEMFPLKKSYRLADCISYIRGLNVPILTTNFDTYMSKSVNAKRFINDLGEYKFTDFYPWNVYYSTGKLKEDILDHFGIWHINGTIDYPRSIRLGLSDYMGCVERARGMIQGNNLNEYFTGKNQSYWKGYNTWLHILFNRNLFIFGLALEQNEVFLRWLLIQRAKYSRLYNRNLHGWYVGKGITEGKRYFLEFLGFKVIELSDYKELYNALK